MSLWDTLTGWVNRDAKQYLHKRIEDSHVDKPGAGLAIEAGRHYVRLRLASMSLKKAVQAAKGWLPAVHTLTRFDFGDKSIELPGIADASRVGLSEGSRDAVVGRNYELTPIVPFNGGIISINAGLIALEDRNYLKAFLDTLGGFADLLKVTQLSTTLAVVQPLSRGIQELFSSGSGRVHLGFYNSYAAGELREGYIAVVHATEEEVDPDSLYVVEGQLRVGTGLGAGQHRAFDGYDYMLLRVEVFETRDDWEQLTSIQEPFQQSLTLASDPASKDAALARMREAVQRARQAPELTKAHRRVVIDNMIAEFKQEEMNGAFAGAVRGGLPTLASVMHDSAAQIGLASIHDDVQSFDELEELLPGITTAKELAPAAPTAAGAEAVPAPAPAAKPEFYLSLLGEAVAGDRVKAGTDFDLIFNYDVPPAEALATLTGGGLQQLPAQETELNVMLIPKGFTLRDGVWSRWARFRGGRMVEPVSFGLTASAAPVEDAKLHLVFTHEGSVLYEFDVTLQVVAALDAGAVLPVRTPLEIDLDAVGSAAGQRTAMLTISADGGGLNVFYQNFKTREMTPVLKLRTLQLNNLSTRLLRTGDEMKKVAEHYIWSEGDNPLEPPATPERKKERESAFSECLQLVATSGWSLYSDLSADEDFAAVLDKVSGLDPGSTLCVNTDCAFVPWEILYPVKYHHEWDADAVRPYEFWGARLSIESLLLGKNSGYAAPLAAHARSPVSVALNFNPTIDDSFKVGTFKPVAAQLQAAERLKSGQVSVETYVGGDKIKSRLRKAPNEATLIYFYCHGRCDNVYQPGQTEMLEVDSKEYIDPNYLDPMKEFAAAPVVFLNSCSSGAFSPLSFSSFLTKFKSKRALGLITTHFTVPASFGAAFGQKLIESYAAGEPLGHALYTLRRSLLAEHNPLGLFYTLQCPLEVAAGTGRGSKDDER